MALGRPAVIWESPFCSASVSDIKISSVGRRLPKLTGTLSSQMFSLAQFPSSHNTGPGSLQKFSCLMAAVRSSLPVFCSVCFGKTAIPLLKQATFPPRYMLLQVYLSLLLSIPFVENQALAAWLVWAYLQRHRVFSY